MKFWWKKTKFLRFQAGTALSTPPPGGGRRPSYKHKPPWCEWWPGILGQRKRQHWLVSLWAQQRVRNLIQIGKEQGVREERRFILFLPFSLHRPLWFPALCWYKWHRWKTDPPVHFHCHQLLLSLTVPPLLHRRLAPQARRLFTGLLFYKWVQSLQDS